MPGRIENRYKKKKKGFHGAQKQKIPVRHQQQTTSNSAASNNSTPSTSYNDQLKQNTFPDKLNHTVEKIERNCTLKTKKESKVFTRKRAFTESDNLMNLTHRRSRNTMAIKLSIVFYYKLQSIILLYVNIVEIQTAI